MREGAWQRLGERLARSASVTLEQGAGQV